LTRAEFLLLAALAWLPAESARAALARRRQAPGAAPDSQPQRIAGVIEAFDRQGFHRTGTDVDHISGEWLEREAARRGADTTRETFPLQRFDLRAAYVEIGGRRLDGLPLFDGGTTGPGGIVARLGPAGSGSPLLLATLDAAAISSEGRFLEALRRSGQPRGIVAVTKGAHPGLSPSNAVSFANPYGVPVLQVSSEHEAWLRERAAGLAEATLVVDAARTAATARNVVATIRGANPALAPLFVITPRSGWFHCASERGGGIACWLEMIGILSATSPMRRVVFIASSGHELGHLGLDAALESRPGIVRSASAWIHLGANIGAAGGRPRLQASDDAMEAVAAAALERAGAPVDQRMPRGTVPAGEARNIHVGGGRYVSLLGSGPYFHNIADRFPAAVDVPAVARFAQALSDCAARLAGSDPPARDAPREG
jgi:hypothetical protein